MKFLIDNNLSFKLVEVLQDSFPGTEHIRNSLGINITDLLLWDYAKANNFIILTKDNDFDERSQLHGCPPKIVHLLCGNQTTSFILGLIISKKEQIILFSSDKESCILKII